MLLYGTDYIFRLQMGFPPPLLSCCRDTGAHGTKSFIQDFLKLSRIDFSVVIHTHFLSSVTTDPGKALLPSSHAVLPSGTRGLWLLSSRAWHCSGLACMRCRNRSLCCHTHRDFPDLRVKLTKMDFRSKKKEIGNTSSHLHAGLHWRW